MVIKLHSQATTTPKIRAAIQASDEPAWVLAERHGTTEQTVWKWRKRDSVEDRSHTPHRLQTTLTPAQEAVAVALRKTLLVSLDDLLAVVRAFLNPDVSRSGLDRCLRRHGVGNLRDLQVKTARPKHSGFKAYEPGYLHIDVKYLPQMADETARRYLFVAIDRATRWVFIRIFKAKTAANARRFLRDLERACPIRIRTILTDNGKEFTDRLFGLRKRAATGEHEFDTLCADLGIEHRLTPPKSPQNQRHGRAIQRPHRGGPAKPSLPIRRRTGDHAAPLRLALQPSTPAISPGQLGSKSPLQAMKDWRKLKPDLFRKRPYYLQGCDTYYKGEEIVVSEEAGISVVVPKPMTSNSGARDQFDKADFAYDAAKDVYICPAGEDLIYRFTSQQDDKAIRSCWSGACADCVIKDKCTTGKERRVRRWEHEGGVSKSCWFALCSDASVRYAEASEAPGDPPCPASIRPNSAACLPA